MKIKLTQAVALMVAIGFPKASEWGAAKLHARVNQVPEKVKRESVPAEHQELYDQIVAAGDAGVQLEAVAAAPAEAEAPAKSKKKKVKGSKVEQAAKSSAASPKVDRDAFGCALGTISAKVNKVLSDTWQSEQEIAEAAGVKLDQARGRLYYGASEKIIEYRKRIEYRLIPATPAAAAVSPKKKKK